MEWTPPNPSRLNQSRDPRRSLSFSRAERNHASETGQADRRYRAVFELFNNFYRISFFPETSILLQIIRIIYMTFPELCQNLTDKGGRLPGLAPGNNNQTSNR